MCGTVDSTVFAGCVLRSKVGAQRVWNCKRKDEGTHHSQQSLQREGDRHAKVGRLTAVHGLRQKRQTPSTAARHNVQKDILG